MAQKNKLVVFLTMLFCLLCPLKAAQAASVESATNRLLNQADRVVYSAADIALALAYKEGAEDDADDAVNDLNAAQTAYDLQVIQLNNATSALNAAKAAGAPPATISALQAQVDADAAKLSTLKSDLVYHESRASRAALTARVAASRYSMMASRGLRRTLKLAERTIDLGYAGMNDAIRNAIKVNKMMNSAIARANRISAQASARANSRSRAAANPVASGGDHCKTGTLGGMICNALNTTTRIPAVVMGFSYVFGLICGFLAIMKLKEHVEGNHQVTIWDPIKRFIAGGMFFALPWVIESLTNTIQGTGGAFFGSNSGFSSTKASGGGLDAMIIKLAGNVMEPIIWATGVFGWVGGLIFVFIGISRLMKSEQEGHRGPTGIGTVMTFLVAGALFSLNSMITFINGSIFDSATIKTHGVLRYAAHMPSPVADHANAVISGLIAFSIIIGWISVTRGLFMVRKVSEGDHQSSMMAAITHLVGGVLAINLGGVITAVQNTLGITTYGFVFH